MPHTGMRLRKCAFCNKDIPHTIMVCPYCRRDEQGRDTAKEEQLVATATLEAQIREDLNGLGHDDPVTRSLAADRIAQKGPAVVPILIALLNERTHKGLSEVAR